MQKKKRNPPNRARPHQIGLSLSDEERAILQAEADRLDLPLTTWARSVLLREAKKGIKQAED
jgi:hypothetical protein